MPHKRPVKAMLFGAGLGKRMRPLTDDMPKPLVQVNGKPIIEYSLDKLAEYGIDEVVVNTHYEAQQMHDYLDSYNKVNITTIFEPDLLDTGGGLLNALPQLGNDPFFVINGDIIWQDTNSSVLESMSDKWISEPDAIGLLLLHEVKKSIGYFGSGDFEIDESTSDIVVSMNDTKNYVYTGIQIIDPKILSGYKVEPFSIIKVYKELINSDNHLPNVKAIVNSGRWFHIGTPEAVDLTESKI